MKLNLYSQASLVCLFSILVSAGAVQAAGGDGTIPKVVGARRLERIGQDILSITEAATRAIQPHTASCQAPENLLPTNKSMKPMDELATCLYLDEYAAAKKPLSFSGSDPKDICSAVWKNGVAPWASPKERAIASLHGSGKKPIPTRASLLKLGWSVASPPEQGEFVSNAIEIRGQVAKSCCGTDTACSKAINDVFVGVCQSPADKNPNVADVCGYASGAYDHTKEEKAAIRGMNLGRPPKSVQSGSVVLSPYFDAQGNPRATNETIRHEFGHACSSIRRQLAVLTDKPIGFNASESLAAQLDHACEVDVANKIAYSDTLTKTNGAAAPSVFSCLQTLSIRASDPKSTVYIEENCKAKKLEEAMAEAIALSSSPDLGPEMFTNRICSSKPSAKHVAGNDIMSCLLKNDPRFRFKFATAMKCGAGR